MEPRPKLLPPAPFLAPPIMLVAAGVTRGLVVSEAGDAGDDPKVEEGYSAVGGDECRAS